MPKIVIPKESLPPISVDDDGYNIKFRLISQDRNRTSYWTPLYTIAAQPPTQISYGLNITSSNVYTGGVATSRKIVNFFWEDPDINIANDIYVNWYPTTGTPSTWQYIATVSANNFSLTDFNSNQGVQVAVQKLTYPKKYSETYALFTSIEHSLL